jgi:hypothetical protein
LEAGSDDADADAELDDADSDEDEGDEHSYRYFPPQAAFQFHEEVTTEGRGYKEVRRMVATSCFTCFHFMILMQCK